MDDYAAIFSVYSDEAAKPGSRLQFSRVLPKHISLASFALAAAALELGMLVALAVFVGSKNFDPDQEAPYLVILGFAFFFEIFLWYRLKLHAIEMIADYRGFLLRLLRLVGFLVLGSLATILLLYRAHDLSHLLPRLGGMAISTFLLFACLRYLIHRIFQFCVQRRLIAHSVALVGVSEMTAPFIRHLHKHQLGVRIQAIYDDAPQWSGQSVEGVSVAGNIADLLSYHKYASVDHVVITAALTEPSMLEALRTRLRMQPLRVRALDCSPAAQGAGYCARLGEIPGVRLSPVLDLPIGWSGRVAKDVFDRMAALAALIILAPLLICCAIGIKLNSRGPVFFRQKRIGYRNQNFYVYKFRSMHVEACDLIKLTARNDPRVFPFGQLMRKLSLDELPQLLNVLRGEMSLVGPRPHMPEARAGEHLYFEVVPQYAARHCVKPGITGWAQVNGWRGPTETVEAIQQRVAHDLHYIAHWSFLLDIRIIFKTAFGGFFGKNAF